MVAARSSAHVRSCFYGAYHAPVRQRFHLSGCSDFRGQLSAGINSYGQIVGSSHLSGNSASHAFLYENGVMTDLGTLGGTHSFALKVNDKGQVVGQAWISGDVAVHAFFYSNGVMTDLGTLGGTNSFANDINISGQVVGESHIIGGNSFNPHGFLYSNGVMTDLNSFLPSGSGWTILEAFSINDSGQIVGAGLINGQIHAFLMTPVAVAGCPNAPSYAYPNDTGALGLYEGQIKDTRLSPNAPTIVTYNISQTELYNIPILRAILGKRNSLWASVVNIQTDPGITLTPNADDPLVPRQISFSA